MLSAASRFSEKRNRSHCKLGPPTYTGPRVFAFFDHALKPKTTKSPPSSLHYFFDWMSLTGRNYAVHVLPQTGHFYSSFHLPFVQMVEEKIVTTQIVWSFVPVVPGMVAVSFENNKKIVVKDKSW